MSDVFYSTLELLNEKKAQGHKRLKEELITMRGAVRQAMDKGLSNEDMAVARTVAESVEAADRAVDKIYNKVSG